MDNEHRRDSEGTFSRQSDWLEISSASLAVPLFAYVTNLFPDQTSDRNGVRIYGQAVTGNYFCAQDWCSRVRVEFLASIPFLYSLLTRWCHHNTIVRLPVVLHPEFASPHLSLFTSSAPSPLLKLAHIHISWWQTSYDWSLLSQLYLDIHILALWFGIQTMLFLFACLSLFFNLCLKWQVMLL